MSDWLSRWFDAVEVDATVDIIDPPPPRRLACGVACMFGQSGVFLRRHALLYCHGREDVDHLGNGTEWRAVRREATHVKVSNPLFCRTAEQMNLTSSVI